MTEEELQEQQEQLVAATQFIIDSKDESVNFRAGGLRFKEGAEAYRSLVEKTVQEVSQALQKQPEAVISQNQLYDVAQTAERAAKKGVASTQCQLPSTERFADEVSKQIVSKVMDQLDSAVGKSMERHHARIDVHHEHHHTNMYGTFASSERNRKMMCWLAFVNVLSISEMTLFLLRVHNIIKWEWPVFYTIFSVTIAITILGFLVRILSNSDH